MEDSQAGRHPGAQVGDAADWLSAAGPAPIEVEPEPEHLPPLRRGQPLPLELCFPDGTPNPYAVMAENRRRADAFYLDTFAITGDHVEAASATCREYDHDARAARCVRCGVGTRG